MTDSMKDFCVGMFFGVLLLGVLVSVFPQHTRPWHEGQRSMMKDLYKKGLAIKEIDKDDKVIYKLKEP